MLNNSNIFSPTQDQNMSTEETILTLFDSLWFENGVFTSNPNPLVSEDEPAVSEDDPAKLTSTMRKSYSDELLSLDSGTRSPNSVLGRHLQTILSGKEVVGSFQDPSPKPEQITKPGINKSRRKMKTKRGSKSLTELEIEELKGFMDLGFVFSDEEKKDSRLVSIIPGLQAHVEADLSVSRPYLSEAWDCLEDEARKNPLFMDWRFNPDLFGNEMEIKHHIKFWAQTVASTVR